MDTPVLKENTHMAYGLFHQKKKLYYIDGYQKKYIYYIDYSAKNAFLFFSILLTC